jgi:hypothetical protein
MKTLGILVLGVVLGLVGMGAAVKYCPDVQKALGVHAAHAVKCDCKNCDCKDCKCDNCACKSCPGKKACTCNPCTCVGGCKCEKCSCQACPGKQNQDPKKECGTKKGCCENHK